jgi:hypothetical protein
MQLSSSQPTQENVACS